MPSDGGGEGDNHTDIDDTSFDTTDRHCSNTTDCGHLEGGDREGWLGPRVLGRLGRVPRGFGSMGLGQCSDVT